MPGILSAAGVNIDLTLGAQDYIQQWERAARQTLTQTERIKGALTSTERVAGASFGRATGYFQNFSRQTRNALGQTALQVQDIAVQFEAGVNPMRIFTQQGSQILGAFGTMGAVLGGAAAIVGALTAAFVEFDDSMEDITKKIDTIKNSIKGLSETYKSASAETRDFIEAQLLLERTELSKQVVAAGRAVRDYNEQIDIAISQARVFSEADIEQLNALQQLVAQFRKGELGAREFADEVGRFNEETVQSVRDYIVELIKLSANYVTLRDTLEDIDEQLANIASTTDEAVAAAKRQKEAAEEFEQTQKRIQAILLENLELQAQARLAPTAAGAPETSTAGAAARQEEHIRRIIQAHKDYQAAMEDASKTAKETAAEQAKRLGEITSAAAATAAAIGAINGAVQALESGNMLSFVGQMVSALASLFVAAAQAGAALGVVQAGTYNYAALAATIAAAGAVVAAIGTAAASVESPQRRATGGPVAAGQPYWVGESGRAELFVPDRAGQVMTEAQVASAGAAGGTSSGLVIVRFEGRGADMTAAVNDPRTRRAMAAAIASEMRDDPGIRRLAVR